MRNALPFLVPSNYLVWPLVCLLRLFGGALSIEERCLFLRVKRARLFGRFAAITLGHAVVMATGASDKTYRHELHHVEQVEAASLQGLWVGVWCAPWNWWLGIAVWVSTPLWAYLAASGVAVLRGEAVYRGNHLEEAARAVAGQAAGEGCRQP